MTRKDLTLISRIDKELSELDLIVKRILRAWEKGVQRKRRSLS